MHVCPWVLWVHGLVLQSSIFVHCVSAWDASSPAAFSKPDAQGLHWLDSTYSFSWHMTGVHVVSAPEASPCGLIVPGAQGLHSLSNTYVFSLHTTGVHCVLVSNGSFPCGLIVPGAHSLHIFVSTYSFSLHVSRVFTSAMLKVMFIKFFNASCILSL